MVKMSTSSECTDRRAMFRRGLVIGLLVLSIVAGPFVAGAVETTSGTARNSVELTGLALSDAADGSRVEISASGPLVWTQYRDERGRLVIELPNATPGDQFESLDSSSGLVESIDVGVAGTAERPLTRITISTSVDTEHELAIDDGLLAVTLSADADIVARSPMPTVEPLPPVEVASVTEMVDTESEPLAPAVDVTAPAETAEAQPEPVPVRTAAIESANPALVVGLGTADEPWVAPPVSGVVASQLREVAVRGSDVLIAGDGAFNFSTFQLDDPARYVVDLHGVVNQASTSTVPVANANLERIRVAQFQSNPAPISRVVFDLTDGALPSIERSDAGLRLSFGSTPDLVERRAESPEPVTSPVVEVPAPVAEAPAPVAVTVGDATPPAEITPNEEIETAAPSVDFEAEAAELAESEMPEWDATPVEPAPPAAAELAEVKPAALPEGFSSDETARPQSDVERYEAMAVQDVVVSEESAAGLVPSYSPESVDSDEQQWVGAPITFSLRDADIKEVLRTFAKISGLNMVVQPGVSGSVTVELEQVPWDQALEQILKINNLGYELEGNIMRIAPQAQLSREAQLEAEREAARRLAVPLRTVFRRVSYAGANEIASLLQSGSASLLSQRGSVAVDGRTNSLIIKELPDYIDSVLAVIDLVDVPEPQVMIEARIVETTKRFSRTLGIQWGFGGVSSPETGNTTGVEWPAQGSIDGGVNLLSGGSNGFIGMTLGNILNTFTLDATLIAAEDEGMVNILSAPKVATLNNESAQIQSGLQIPIQTVANNTVTVQFVNATLQLQVTPHVTAEGTVLLDINIQKREPQLAFAVAGAANAPIATKEARTRVIVRDGGTTVIGGIYEVSTDQGEDRVPGLANIPFLGALFKNKRRSQENEELLIFITPRVMKL